jgi:ABC-2 type transport system permease protein
MAKYLFVAWTSLKTHLVYRAEVVLSVLTTLFTLAIQVFLWRSLYGASPGAIEVSVDAMVTYFILSSVVSLVLRYADTSWELSEDVKKGVISSFLVRPMGYPQRMLSLVVGRCAFALVFMAAPLAVVGALLFHLQAPASAAGVTVAVVVALAAFLIYFVIWFITGMISFWLTELPWAVPSFINAFVWFFSGSMIPLWIYPPWLRAVAQVLPARFAYDMPLSLYIGRVTPAQGLAGLGTEAAWLAGLLLLAVAVWRAGSRKLAIQGG